MSYSEEEKEKFKQKMKSRIYKWSVRLVKFLKEVDKRSDHLIKPLLNQGIRSGTSVCANYVEAIASPTIKDFRKFLSYALKSCNETKYWLSLIDDTEIDKSEELSWLLQEAMELSRILGKSVSTMYKENKNNL